MTNKEFQRELVKLRNELGLIVSGMIALDNAMPKRLKTFTTPRLAIAQPVPLVDVIKALQQACEESRQMAEAWDRIADGATDEHVEVQVDAQPVPVRKLDD